MLRNQRHNLMPNGASLLLDRRFSPALYTKVCDRALCQKRHVYAIRNGRVEPRWLSVERRTTKVARRALETLIYAQGIIDLYRLEVAAARESVDFNVAYIDAQFNYPHPTPFAPDFVK